MRKILGTALIASLFASITISPALADVSANTLPSFKNGTNVDVTTSGNNMNIKIDPNSQAQYAVGTANWNSFNIGKDAKVNVEFTAHNQTSLNYVDAAGGMSQIYGKFTNDSGCLQCGYESTGKVVLINPNGVLFGNTANVNLNSFTASTMDGTYNKNTKTLALTKGANQSGNGIVVQDGAKIHGDKTVAFASNNINIYKGSQITTNTTTPNVELTDKSVVPMGKVKLITSDGVNFSYQNSGTLDQVSNLQSSTDKMNLWIAGDITSGHIDARNLSTHSASELNTNGANLKAYKAQKGSDGNIWLTSNSRVVTENTNIETTNVNSNANNRATGGDVLIYGTNKTNVNGGKINAVGNVTLKATQANGKAYVDKNNINRTNDGTVNADNVKITSLKDVLLDANTVASVQNNSEVKGVNVTVKGVKRGQVVTGSKVTADRDINILSTNDLAWTKNATLTAGQDINIESTNNAVLLQNTTNNAVRNINIKSKDTISSAKIGTSTFTANNVNVESVSDSITLTGTEPFIPTNKLTLKAAKDVQIVKDSALTVAKVDIDAGNDVLLKSNNNTLTVDSTTNFKNAKNIYLQGQNVNTQGTLNVNSLKTNIKAAQDVNVTLANAANAEKGLVAEAGNNMTITTDGTLSVSNLKSVNDMTINANKVIKGKSYMDNPAQGGFTQDTTSSRSYIEVGGKFTSNVANDNFVVTESADRTADGQYNQRHHIQYGNEKLYLVNKRPVENNVTNPEIDDPNNGKETDVLNPDSVIDTPPVVIPTPQPTPTPDPEPQPQPQPQPTNPDPDPTCSGDPAANDVLNTEDDPTAGM